MKNTRISPTSPSLLIAVLILAACNLPVSVDAQNRPASLVTDAVSSDEVIAENAISSLRARGPEGLRLLLDAYRTQLAGLSANPQTANDPAIGRIRHAVDRVAAQRDAFASGLYWYTNLDEAKRAAARLGRPILSLRLLGRLDEEYSCANSRLFRTTLYPNASVAARLRDGFVLHWSTERPAPIVRIDMGDGRTVTRTITGNSVHYVLNSRGEPIDAIPGLYGPAAFLAKLDQAANALRQCEATPATARVCIQRWHAERITIQETEWATLQQRSPQLRMYALDGQQPQFRVANSFASAMLAERLTVSKMAVEQPVLRVLGAPRVAAPETSEWAYVAPLLNVGELDAASLGVIRLKLDGETFDQARLQSNIATDTAQNEFDLHRRIHRLFQTDHDFDSLNTEIYTSLFLTPRSDPWLGLRSDELFDALEEVHGDSRDGGVVERD